MALIFSQPSLVKTALFLSTLVTTMAVRMGESVLPFWRVTTTTVPVRPTTRDTSASPSSIPAWVLHAKMAEHASLLHHQMRTDSTQQIVLSVSARVGTREISVRVHRVNVLRITAGMEERVQVVPKAFYAHVCQVLLASPAKRSTTAQAYPVVYIPKGV